MKYSTFDAFAQDMDNQNYDSPAGYVCLNCYTENDADEWFCAECGEQILFSDDEMSEYFETSESTAKTSDLSEPLF